MVSPRSYTPGIISPDDLKTMLQRIGVARVVIVQISVHGTDNSCLVDGLRALGDCARGVAQVAAGTPVDELERLHTAGVRGIRVNLASDGVRDPTQAKHLLETAARACEPLGWHLQVFAQNRMIAALGPVFQDLPVPVVFDHFGLLPVRERGDDAERVILDLLENGVGWVKISATYRLDPAATGTEVTALARDLYAANPENVVWGSDWPHPPQHQSRPEPNPAPQPYRDIDPAVMLATIRRWFDDPQDWQRILVTNPARLYDFPR